MEDQKIGEKKWYTNKWFMVLVVLIICIIGLDRIVNEKPISNSKLTKYEIVEEKDYSYSGCKRVAISILVPDNTNLKEIYPEMNKIIANKKKFWDEVTVFGYKISERKEFNKKAYTMGKKEYSTCK